LSDVGPALWNSLTERGPVSIAYLPNRPAANRVVGSSKLTLLLIFSFVGGLLSIAGGTIVTVARSSARTRRRLLTAGVRAPATVADVKAMDLSAHRRHEGGELLGRADEGRDVALVCRTVRPRGGGDQSCVLEWSALRRHPRRESTLRAILWLINALYLIAQPEWGIATEARQRSADKREQSVDVTGHLSPTAFQFVVPGVSRSEVDRRLGKPYMSSISVVAKGRIDLFVDEIPSEPSNPQRAPQPTEDVHYYDYRPASFVSEYARIVFRRDKVWYAMLPPQSGEKTRVEIIAHYGNVFEEDKVHRRSGHILSVDVILWLRKNGLAFVEKPSRGITHRVVFPVEPSQASRAEGTSASTHAQAAAIPGCRRVPTSPRKRALIDVSSHATAPRSDGRMD
jgi:hypothetical protein